MDKCIQNLRPDEFYVGMTVRNFDDRIGTVTEVGEMNGELVLEVLWETRFYSIVWPARTSWVTVMQEVAIMA